MSKEYFINFSSVINFLYAKVRKTTAFHMLADSLHQTKSTNILYCSAGCNIKMDKKPMAVYC